MAGYKGPQRPLGSVLPGDGLLIHGKSGVTAIRWGERIL